MLVRRVESRICGGRIPADPPEILTARCRRGGLGAAPPTRATLLVDTGLIRQPAAGAGAWGQRPQLERRRMSIPFFCSGLIAGARLVQFRFLSSDPPSQREFHPLSCNPVCLSVCHITVITTLPTQHGHISEVKIYKKF